MALQNVPKTFTNRIFHKISNFGKYFTSVLWTRSSSKGDSQQHSLVWSLGLSIRYVLWIEKRLFVNDPKNVGRKVYISRLVLLLQPNVFDKFTNYPISVNVTLFMDYPIRAHRLCSLKNATRRKTEFDEWWIYAAFELKTWKFWMYINSSVSNSYSYVNRLHGFVWRLFRQYQH